MFDFTGSAQQCLLAETKTFLTKRIAVALLFSDTKGIVLGRTIMGGSCDTGLAQGEQ